MAKKQTIDSAFSELEKMVRELDNEAVPLENLELHIKKANELMKYCQEQLNSISQNITKIVGKE